MVMKKYIVYIFSIVILLVSCNSEKEIEINLPPFESELYVECYIEPGQPYRLALYGTVDYFEKPELPDIKSALVIISHNGINDTLRYFPILDPTTGKFYNYAADTSKKIVMDAGDYHLYIKDSLGRELTGSCYFLPVVPISSIDFVYNEDSVAYAKTIFYDDLNTRDYYRYQITLDNMKGRPRTDRIFTDQYISTSQVILGSNYNLDNHTDVIITLYHISPEYHQFLQSENDAQNANGNPFAQPAPLKSTVTGGVGVFATLSYDRRFTVVEP
jgi:hypothetical protein